MDKQSQPLKIRIDTETVIFQVQLRPLLWDKRNKLHKNRPARDAAWLEICKEMYPEFETFTKEEQKHIDKKLQERWRTARDMYKKEKVAAKQSSRSGVRKKRKYAYFEMLTFLDKVIDTGTEESPSAEVTTPSPTIAEVPLTTPIFLPPIPSMSAVSKPSAVTTTQNEATNEMENHMFQYLKKNELELESDDLAFFQSLQPTLKTFTTYQKMMFRTKVMQIIMDIENPVYSSGRFSANDDDDDEDRKPVIQHYSISENN